ncbi:DnaA/Hda family protein [Planobispora siamensis]|uniref:IstB-like ATP-binding domain-containing protein n=1 Tax=Planobispora siamensis TaxID=936338 RepID=A0A8J3WP58_9ACTN|nr:DnaA/Hda family protein [Planobispora siamensis]GIH95252.1 hypothetical protein Psi01_58820 [Planobispora siamensis]
MQPELTPAVETEPGYLPVHRDPDEVQEPLTSGHILFGEILRRDRDGIALEAMRTRLAEIIARGGHLTAVDDYGPADVAADVDALRRRNNLTIWQRLVEDWPDGDYRDATLETLTAEQGAQEVRAWAANPTARTLVLNGDVGRGKTHVAFAALGHFAHQGMRVHAVSEARYLTALRPDGGGLPAYRVRQMAEDADALLVDDLGAGRDVSKPVTEFAATEIGSLISAFLRRDKRLLITTNLNPDQLGIMYGPRIMSRLVQQATPIWVEGEDRRPFVLPKTWGGRPATPRY